MNRGNYEAFLRVGGGSMGFALFFRVNGVGRGGWLLTVLGFCVVWFAQLMSMDDTYFL